MAAPQLILSAEEIQLQARLPENRGAHTLYRSDTHGTEVPVVMGVTEEFAGKVMLQLEKNPHHQGYWIRVPGMQPS